MAKFSVIEDKWLRLNPERERILAILDKFLLRIRADEIVRREVKMSNDVLHAKGEKFTIGEDVHIIGFGKAAGEMARAMEGILGSRLKGGMVNTDHDVSLSKVKMNIAAHPIPDESTVEYSQVIVNYISDLSEESTIIFLITGGASSLFEIPTIPLNEYVKRVSNILRSGKSIEEINRMRTSLSKVKGGKLLKHVKGRWISLIISDVPHGFEYVGSGPTFGKGGKNVLLADNLYARYILHEMLKERGYVIKTHTQFLQEDVRSAAENIIRECREQSFITGGEVSVNLKNGYGVGGRAQELALLVAKHIKDEIFIALGTDGKDGNSPAAGAMVDGKTVEIMREEVNVENEIRKHNSYGALMKSRDIIITGPTGTNLADIYLCLKKV